MLTDLGSKELVVLELVQEVYHPHFHVAVQQNQLNVED